MSSMSDDSSISSDSSDDEIRKKLMMSYYGDNVRTSITTDSDDEYNNDGTIQSGVDTTLNTQLNNKQSNQQRNDKHGAHHTNPAASALASDFGPSALSPLPSSPSPPSHRSPLKTTTPLDSPTFDPLSYTRNALLTSPIESLLITDDELVSKVQDLDSTMQTLVYENYSKFIDATDAIRSIGKSVDKATEEMDRLLAVITSVSSSSEEIDSDLSESRQMVADKLRVKRQLSRLDNILKLPFALRSLVNVGRYKDAATKYNASKSILSTHSSTFSSLASISSECSLIMSSVLKKAKSTLEHLADESNALPTPTPSCKFIFQITSTISILSTSPPTPQTQTSYLRTSMSAASRSLSRTLNDLNDDVNNGGVGVLDFLDCVSKAARHLRATINEGKGGGKDKSGIGDYGDDEDEDDIIVEFVKDAFNKFLVTVKETWFKSCEDFTPGSTSKLTSFMTSLVTRTRTFVNALTTGEAKIPRGKLGRFGDRSVEAVSSVMDRRIACRYRKLRVEVRDELKVKCRGIEGGGRNEVFGREVCDMIKKLHHSAIMSFSSLSSLPLDPSMLSVSVHSQARTFVLWVPSALECCAGCVGSNVVVALHSDEDDVNGGGRYEDDLNSNVRSMREKAVEEDPFDVDMRELERIGKEIEGTGNATLPLAIAEAARAGEEIIPHGASSSLRELNAGGEGGITDVDMDGACSLRFGISGTRCLEVYMRDVGNEAGELLGLGVVNPAGGEAWTGGSREVREVREGVTMMLGVIKRTSIELGGAFGESPRCAPANTVSNAGAVSVPSNFANQQASRGGVAMDIERMFVKATGPGGGGVEFNRESVVEGAMIIALKGLLEGCRLGGDFSPQGFGQLRCDLYLLVSVLPHYLGNVGGVEVMVERCLQSARDRGGGMEGGVKDAVVAGVVGKWMEKEVNEGRNGGGVLIWDD